MTTGKENVIKELTIFGININNYSIVCDKQAPSGVYKAIEEFKNRIFEATGVMIPMSEYDTDLSQIVIGLDYCVSEKCKTARERIENDGFAFIGEDNKLFITANVYRGVVHGIYALLEDYIGVRYCSSRYYVIHPAEKIDIPSDLCVGSNPKMIYRNAYWTDFKNPSEKINQLPVALRDNTTHWESFGEGCWFAGHMEKFAHTILELAEIEYEEGLQPCLSDEKVFNTVLKNVKKRLEKNKGSRIISVSQNDSGSWHLGCQCEKCRAVDEREGTPMGSLLTFVNRIADAIKDDYPDVYVETLAYRYTRKAPKTIIPRDNVIIRLCSIECCFCHPFDDASCKANTEFKKDVEEWSKICKNLFVWDYTTNFHAYVMPFPNLHILHKNMKFFAEHNVIGVFAQGNCLALSAEFGELRAYLISKLMWNPYMSEKEYFEYMDGFLRDYYGAGYKHIRKYIDRTSEISAQRTHSHCETEDIAVPLENREEVMELLEEWKAAEREAETEKQKQHLKLSMLQMLSLADSHSQFGFNFKDEIVNTLKENNLYEPYKKYYA